MDSPLVELLCESLRGKHSHVNPAKALQGLTHTTATQQMEGDAFNAYELLYHIVFWQDVTLSIARGDNIDWKEMEGKDWPSYDELEKAHWDALRERFLSGLKEAEKLVGALDLRLPMPTWNNEPVAKAFAVLATHNSYHLGQIVAARRMWGLWPPLDSNPE